VECIGGWGEESSSKIDIRMMGAASTVAFNTHRFGSPPHCCTPTRTQLHTRLHSLNLFVPPPKERFYCLYGLSNHGLSHQPHLVCQPLFLVGLDIEGSVILIYRLI
jgi:hypothetical protein